MNDRGTLAIGEPHPAAFYALRYINSLSLEEQMVISESFASCAIEGNRLAEICSETMYRLMTKQSVSDRYLLGLAWAIREIKEKKNG